MLSNRNAFLLFFACGILLYGNTLFHDYTLDDAIVITENEFTKKGFSGVWDQLSNDQFVGFYGTKKELVSGGRYRPLSMVVFNIQYALAGESAFIGHLCNVLFYILNGFLLYLLLSRLIPPDSQMEWIRSLPLLASMLWFFHPIHTEVVANIKGLDEIMAFSLELATLLFILHYLKNNRLLSILLVGLTYFLALLSKENAITWLAIIPLSIYFFTNHAIKKSIPAYATIFGVACIWLFIRYEVVGGGISNVADNLMNDPFLESSIAEKYATIMLTLGKYVQLMIFPHPLTYDYYPKHIPIVGWGNPYVILSIFTYLFLIAVAIWGLVKKHISSYGILIFFITLSIASNILFPIGAFMNERFVYVSSLGFSMILAYLLLKGSEKMGIKLTTLKSFFFVVLALYTVKTFSRNLVWKDNLTLATHDANVSINGAKSNVMAGGLLTEEAMKENDPTKKNELLQRALVHLDRAVTIYPEYIDALILMGNAQWEYTKNAENAMAYYLRILNINPSHQNAIQNCIIILEQSQNPDVKINGYKSLLQYNPAEVRAYLNLGRAYGREKNELANAQFYLEKGREIAPNNYDILSNLGTLYGIQANYLAAIEVLEKAKTIRPNVAKIYVDLGLSYYYSGQLENAKRSFDEAVQVDPTLNRANYPI